MSTPAVPSNMPNGVQAQAAAIQQILSATGALQAGQRVPFAAAPPPQAGADPQAILAQLNAAGVSAPSQPPAGSRPSEPAVTRFESSGPAHAKTSWNPTESSDQALKNALSAFHRLKAKKKTTLGSGRVLGDLLLEAPPDGLRMLVDEDEKVGVEGVMEGSGLPGHKRRRIQEIAETVDKGLVVSSDIEEVSPSLPH